MRSDPVMKKEHFTQGVASTLLTFYLLTTPILGNAADWVNVGENAGGTFYIDQDTIKNVHNGVRVWTLVDLKQQSPDGTKSVKMLALFDCEVTGWIQLNGYSYSGKMGSGEVLRTDPRKHDIQYAPPGSVMEYTIQKSCASINN